MRKTIAKLRIKYYLKAIAELKRAIRKAEAEIQRLIRKINKLEKQIWPDDEK